jgi:hypothetical protein
MNKKANDIVDGKFLILFRASHHKQAHRVRLEERFFFPATCLDITPASIAPSVIMGIYER